MIFLSKSAFYATILLSLKHTLSDTVSTAAVGGTQVYYNPKFLEPLTLDQTIFLMLHEVMHVALDHSGRVGTRVRTIWNMAGDYVINYILRSSGYEFIESGLYDAKYKDMTTEQVYEDLLSNASEEPYEGDIIYDDSPGTTASIKEILVKAATVSKQSKEWGNLPSELTRAIDDLINPQLPWHVYLQNYLSTKTKDDYSWKKPNRRYTEYMPSRYSEGIGNVIVAIDTSGSITREDLTFILSEIQYIKDTFNISKLTLISCDSSIHNIHEVEMGDSLLDLPFNGGGGTDIQPILDYAQENDPTVVIYFTDGYMNLRVTPPSYDFLWVIYNNPDFIAPFGSAVHYKS